LETLHVRVVARASDFTLDVHFDVPPGMTILFGPSGAGKSTVLAAIAGLVRPDAGRIALGDDTWFDSATGVDRAVHLRGLAFVFQSLALFPHMTAAANVEYGIDRATAATDRRRLALAMLERMQVLHLAERRPRTFSGGEAQRVALARAFARSPRVVLLDEPFSALDRDLRRGLVADVKTIVSDLGVPAVLVTHHREDARTLGDRIVILDRGRVASSGIVTEHLSAGSADYEASSRNR
jgi:molybdate transport system ATP-binding protein